MTSTHASSHSERVRARIAAALLATAAIGYSLVSVFYFYEDFFKYLGGDAATMTDRTGWLVSVDGMYLWSILSPWRLAGAALAVSLLGVSAYALWKHLPKARSLSIFTLWGVLLPQVLWYTEFVADWHHSNGMMEIVLVALAVATVPTLLLVRRGQALADWQTEWPNRLLGLAIASAWIGFAATEYIDHAYVMMSDGAYIGALVAIPLAALAVKGIFGMRAWALWASVTSALALAVIPLAASWTSYVGTGGYIDEFQVSAASSDTRIAFAMLIPLAIVWAMAAPYLHAFVRKLRA